MGFLKNASSIPLPDDNIIVSFSKTDCQREKKL